MRKVRGPHYDEFILPRKTKEFADSTLNQWDSADSRTKCESEQ